LVKKFSFVGRLRMWAKPEAQVKMESKIL